MYRICVFAGTTEGREIVEFLSSQPVEVTACVATEYGEMLLSPANNLTILTGCLSENDITGMLSGSGYDLAIDATHPYAASVTESIFAACSASGTEYLRLLRKASEPASNAVYVPDVAEAADFLDGTRGNILLTTGSKELAGFSRIADFADRVYARVLPLDDSVRACREAGLKASHIIAMQGPFSEEMNAAMIHAASASWLVSKDGGEAGGFDAKASAAAKAGARLVVIGRPLQREGMSFSETIELLCSRFGCIKVPRVVILGIGPGNSGSMTKEACLAVKHADCLIGAGRMLEAAAVSGQGIYEAVSAEDIAEYIRTHGEYRNFAVAMSGDAGFFSGTKKLIPLLDGCEVRVLPGISSLSYLCARLKTSYEDVFVTSVHGRRHDIVPDVRAHSRVFVLAGGNNGMQALCRSMSDAGLGSVKVSIGERLSYPDEKITQGTAEELAGGSYETLSVALIENDSPDAVVTHGLPDSMFMRGAGDDGVVPMTKSEVRAVCLSKLRLTERAVCWDIGAGTGSVAVEMALQAKKGQVFAIEYKSAALELLNMNREKFSAENLTVISGRAPEACADLPAPSHAFIGGSSGNMRDIIELLIRKNPYVRIVATAVSMESAAELTACINSLRWVESEVISVQIAQDRKAGPYHLMAGRNPIYVFTMQSGG